MLPTYGAYVATKGAVEQVSHVLAKELGPRGITVNVISPGPTDTELFGQGEDRARQTAIRPDGSSGETREAGGHRQRGGSAGQR